MNKWFLLLLVIGLVAAGWMNRDRISDWMGHQTAEATPPPATPRPRPTPNPAPASVALASKTYPALGQQGSAFNLRFVALYNELKVSNPDILAQPDWPMVLAERTAKELAGRATPTPASTPPPRPGATPGPLFPPGLQGSSLDQRPAPRNPR